MRDGQAQNHNIRKDSCAAVGEPDTERVDAVAFELRLPQLLNGSADKREEKRHCECPDDDEGTCANDEALELGEAEDAVVHEEQAELGPAQVPDIDDFGDEQPHGNVFDALFR